MADQQMPIWRLVRREFLRNLSRARALKPRLGMTPADKAEAEE